MNWTVNTGYNWVFPSSNKDVARNHRLCPAGIDAHDGMIEALGQYLETSRYDIADSVAGDDLRSVGWMRDVGVM